MNLFDETNAPYAVPLRYKGLELVRYNKRNREQPFTYVTESWNESVDIETEKLRAIEQEKIDRYWYWKDLADAGDETAALFVTGHPWKYDKPKSRTAGIIFIEDWNARNLRTYTKCRQCGTPMAAISRLFKYCTPSCLKESKAARQRPFNKARPKVERHPKTCEHCASVFTPARSDARFCSVKCRVANSRVKSTE